jgi:hypothetical protein
MSAHASPFLGRPAGLPLGAPGRNRPVSSRLFAGFSRLSSIYDNILAFSEKVKKRFFLHSYSEIRAAEYNPRTITPEALKLIRENIKRVGLNVLSGHQRLACLDVLNGKKEDYEITVSLVELTEQQEKEQNIFMNNPFAMGEYDQEKLPELLKGINIDFSGFSAADVHREWGEDILKDKPEALLEMSKKIDEFSATMTAFKEKSNKRDDDMDFYLVLVFKSYEDRKAYTDKYGLPDDLFQDPSTLTDRITTGDVSQAPCPAE